MPRSKGVNTGARLEKQVADLQRQLKTCQRAMEKMQAEHEKSIQEAADIGYEMGRLDAEEYEIHRAEVIAEATAKFEQTYAKKMSRVVPAERASLLQKQRKANSFQKRSLERDTEAHNERGKMQRKNTKRVKKIPQSDQMPVAETTASSVLSEEESVQL